MKTGYEAIEAKERDENVTLNKYADPIDGAEENISIDRAREISAEDPALIWSPSSAAAFLGRKGGKAKSAAKAKAAAANGAKGGRPIRTPGTIGDGYYASDQIALGDMCIKLWAKPHGETVEFLCRYTARGNRNLDRPEWPLFAVRGNSDNAATKIRRRLAPWESEIPGLDSVLADLESQIA